MKLKQLTIVLAIPIVCATAVMSWQGRRILPVTPSQPGNVSFATAKNALRLFVVALGRPVQSIKTEHCRQIVDPNLINTYEIPTTGKLAFSVNARTGVVSSFRDMERIDEQYRGINRTGTNRFATDQQAKNFCRQIATTLGVPTTVPMTKFLWTQEGQRRDANKAGSISAMYKTTGKYWLLGLDPQDGLLVTYSHHVRE